MHADPYFTTRMKDIVLLALSAVLFGGCAGSQKIAKPVAAAYQELYEIENRFKPNFLNQDPNKDATYASVLDAQVAEVVVTLNAWSAHRCPLQSNALMEHLMLKYGVTGSFVAFPSRGEGSETKYDVPVSRVDSLDVPHSAYYKFLANEQ